MPTAEKLLQKPQLPKIPVQALLTDSHLTAVTLDEEQSRPPHKCLILYIRLTISVTTSHCVFDESHILIACKYVYLMFCFNKLIDE